MVPLAAMATPLGAYQGPFYANWRCCSLPTMPGSDATVNGKYGTAVRRREDPPLDPGDGDLHRRRRRARARCTRHFVRSEVAHGRIVGIETEAAAAAPGVAGVFTGADLDLGALPAGADGARRHAAPDAGARRRALPGRGDRGGRGREPRRRRSTPPSSSRSTSSRSTSSSIPSARSTTTRRSCSPTRARTSPSRAATPTRARSRAPTSWCAAASSTSAWPPCRWSRRRPWPCPIEETGGVRIWAPLQAPHTARDVFAGALGLEKDAVHVTVPNVGGGFGARIAAYPEQAAVAAAALRLGKPVRYVESRWETMIAMQHGRAQVQDVELGARSDGTLVGIRVHVIADCGAYPGDAVIMPFLTGQMASGVYAHPARGLRLSLRGHQHDADRRLPRRRAPRGDRADRARDGPARRQARHGPGRAAPAQLHRARRLPPQDGRRRHLRLGRVRARAGARARGRRLRRAARRAGAAARARRRASSSASACAPTSSSPASASRSAPAPSTRTASSRSRPAPRRRARATRRRGRSSCRGRSACRWPTCASCTPTRARSRAAWARWARARCRSAAAR